MSATNNEDDQFFRLMLLSSVATSNHCQDLWRPSPYTNTHVHVHVVVTLLWLPLFTRLRHCASILRGKATQIYSSGLAHLPKTTLTTVLVDVTNKTYPQWASDLRVIGCEVICHPLWNAKTSFCQAFKFQRAVYWREDMGKCGYNMSSCPDIAIACTTTTCSFCIITMPASRGCSDCNQPEAPRLHF